MLNLIKADIYRLIHDNGVKAFYGILIFVIGIQAISETSGTIGVANDGPIINFFENLTGFKAIFASLSVAGNYVYFLIPLIIVIISRDFSDRAIKNVIGTGFSRVKYFFSKLILLASCIFIMLVLNVAITVLIGTLKNGFNGSVDGKFLENFLKAFFMQFYLFLGLGILGSFFVFAFRKISIFIGLFIGVTLFPAIVAINLSNIYKDAINILKYSIETNIRYLGDINVLKEIYTRSILMGSIMIGVSIILGIIVFKKVEIR